MGHVIAIILCAIIPCTIKSTSMAIQLTNNGCKGSDMGQLTLTHIKPNKLLLVRYLYPSRRQNVLFKYFTPILIYRYRQS